MFSGVCVCVCLGLFKALWISLLRSWVCYYFLTFIYPVGVYSSTVLYIHTVIKNDTLPFRFDIFWSPIINPTSRMKFTAKAALPWIWVQPIELWSEKASGVFFLNCELTFDSFLLMSWAQDVILIGCQPQAGESYMWYKHNMSQGRE